MRISDWSSDVFSSDLFARDHGLQSPAFQVFFDGLDHRRLARAIAAVANNHAAFAHYLDSKKSSLITPKTEDKEACGTQRQRDRKRVVSGKRVSVRVDLGGRRSLKKKKQ